MNQIEPTSYPPTRRNGQKALPKRNFFTLTFYELLTIIISAAIPLAIAVYTVIRTNQYTNAENRQLDEQSQIARKSRELDIELAAETRQQQIYDKFIDDVYILHKDGELNDSAEPWAFANARYRVAHLQWDAKRKSDALQFLKDRQLIGRSTCQKGRQSKHSKDIIRLNELNFDHINLASETGKWQVDLTCTHFDQVSMKDAIFTKINFNGASFEESRLNGATFSQSSFAYAIFNRTELHNVDFGDSNLEGAIFDGVDLSTTKLNEKQKQQISINNTTDKMVTMEPELNNCKETTVFIGGY